MWTSWLQNSSIPALTQSIDFAQKRHSILAGNIANMDTPGYETRDLNVDQFQTLLRDAIDKTKSTGESASPGVTSPSNRASESWQKARDVSNQIMFHDGHDVSLEQQVTEVSKNQSMHNTAIALLRSQFHTLQMAITENVNV